MAGGDWCQAYVMYHDAGIVSLPPLVLYSCDSNFPPVLSNASLTTSTAPRSPKGESGPTSWQAAQ